MPALRPDLANKRDSNHDGNIADRDEFGRPARLRLVGSTSATKKDSDRQKNPKDDSLVLMPRQPT
jgi:hypothetical protein